MDKFNHSLLVLAREARGFTQAELALRADLAQGTLSKYETGVLEPTAEQVGTLSIALDFPQSFFLQVDRPYGFPPYHYRRRKKLSAKALGKIVAEMNIRRLHIQKLNVAFGAEIKTGIPEIDRDEFQGRAKKRLDIEDVARSVREMWMLPSGPVQSMMDSLEANGAIIVPCNFGTDLLDAMSQRIDGLPSLIFVNVNSPADRLRHTLAHELAHMVLHTTTLHDDDTMEEEADRFAGAFLLPADQVRPQLRQFNLRHLANMKSYWKVSMAAIAVRADQLNLITDYQKKMFWMEMSRLGYRKREPNEPPHEQPRLLKAMVGFHRNKLGYSNSEIARMLHVHAHEFEKMYGPEVFSGSDSRRPQLRVIK
jgi:Zn-dependent peptidase ImmA (M78 family)/transcriptional regulator with XRE-family HTH domain